LTIDRPGGGTFDSVDKLGEIIGRTQLDKDMQVIRHQDPRERLAVFQRRTLQGSDCDSGEVEVHKQSLAA